MDRFSRIRHLIGDDNFNKLLNKKVVVVGIGAVGSHVVEALVRCGISNIRIIDFDKIKKSNINRQLCALESTLGNFKVDATKERILNINPNCKVEAMKLFLHSDTIDVVLSGNPDLVIDAIDSLKPKTILLKEVYLRKIPIISSMGAARKTDPFKIRTGDLFDTKFCRLAKFLRDHLKKEGIGRGIRCVYSEEIFLETQVSLQNDINEEDYSRGRKRAVLGSMPTITGIFGYIIANEAIFKLIND